jgi:hypothetical protein
MASPRQPKGRNDFEIAIICALRSEADAVEALFDKFWGDDGDMFGKAPTDPNAYTTGVIGLHNVVLVYMPSMGKGSAASVASSFRSSFGALSLPSSLVSVVEYRMGQTMRRKSCSATL